MGIYKNKSISFWRTTIGRLMNRLNIRHLLDKVERDMKSNALSKRSMSHSNESCFFLQNNTLSGMNSITLIFFAAPLAVPLASPLLENA